MLEYDLNIWLEIHIKIKSKNKLFCQCKNEQNFDTLEPNINTCPVCLWLPWALPTLSYEAVYKSLLVWKVLNCKINKESSFDRKSYFYPDLPMWYQITQLYNPTNTDWEITFFVDKEYKEEKTIRIRDAHLENDTAKMIHWNWKSLIDFNRSWTPLVEIVTQPDFTNSIEITEFLKELQRRMKYNNISDADMDKWQMRVDVNISIKPKWQKKYWTRVELKNINSFWMIRRAIENEYNRQLSILKTWKKINQETRWRNDLKWESFSMRSKENAIDYRYFPEPDLWTLYLNDEILSKINNEKLIIPHRIIKNFRDIWFNKEYTNAIISDKKILDYFYSSLRLIKNVKNWNKEIEKTIAKRISWPILSYLNSNFTSIDKLNFSQQTFINFINLANEKKFNNNNLKKIFEELLNKWWTIEEIIKKLWLNKNKISNEDLIKICKKVLDKNQNEVEKYKTWKKSVIWFFIWQIMKETKWNSNPQEIKKILENILK